MLTGNPVRDDFFTTTREAARERLGLSADVVLVVIMGGSLGAKTLIDAVFKLSETEEYTRLRRVFPNLRIVLSTGKMLASHYAECVTPDGVQAEPYLYESHLWLAAADLFVGRSGAMTCSELMATGTPAVLIPFPYAAGDHQTYNAESLASHGAAVTMRDADLSATRLAATLECFLTDRVRLKAMSAAAKEMAQPEAAQKIVETLKAIERP